MDQTTDYKCSHMHITYVHMTAFVGTMHVHFCHNAYISMLVKHVVARNVSPCSVHYMLVWCKYAYIIMETYI